MRLAITAGITFFALEIVVIAWLFHWLLVGTVSLAVVTIPIALALAVTLFVWALIAAAKRADDEMEQFKAACDGQNLNEYEVPNASRRWWKVSNR